MFDFVDYFIGKSVVLHATTKDMKMDLLSVAKEVNKLGKYAAVASYNQGTFFISRQQALSTYSADLVKTGLWAL